MLRKLLIAASALAIAVPVAAQPYPDPVDEEIARSLPAPGEIEAMGDAVGRTADALMDVDIGPIVDAVDPAARYQGRHRGRTLGDLATRDDPYARERIQRDIEAATAGLGVMIDRIAVLAPALRHSIEDSRRRIEDALYGHPAPRPDYPEYLPDGEHEPEPEIVEDWER